MANERERKLAATAKKWETVSKLWIPAAGLPGVSRRQGSSQTVQILNEREFIVITDDDQIFKYSTHRDEWTLFLTIPETEYLNGRPGSHKLDLAMVVDQDTNRLFVTTKLGKEFKDTVWDIETGSIVHCQQYNPSNHLVQMGRLVNAGGDIHKLWGPNWDDFHAVWDEMNHVWDYSVHDQYLSSIYGPMRGFTVIHVPSKRIILMIGGRDLDKWLNIWRFDIDSGNWDQIQLEIDLDFMGCTAVLTSDEQHVIITGGMQIRPGVIGGIYTSTGGNRDNHIIHILDISDDHNYKLRESAMKTPPFWSQHIARSGGRMESALLVPGWIQRVIEKEEDLKMKMPSELIKMACQWCSIEMLHWISGESHRKILLTDIL